MEILYFVYLVVLEFFVPTIRGIRSTTCWDNVSGPDYIGTQIITLSGYTCQAWYSDTPHFHNTDQPSYFPYDTDTGPSNYCRDPGGWSSVGPWCYTMNPSVVWETCGIAICTNLPCATVGNSTGQADPGLTIANLDSNTGKIHLIQSSTAYDISCCGTIGEWRIYASVAGEIRLQVWRHNSSNGLYKLIGENVYILSSGDTLTSKTYTVLTASRISVEYGDLIGWYTPGTDMIPFSVGTISSTTAILSSGVVNITDEVNFGGATTETLRDYAIGATIERDLIPSFTNAASVMSITTAETIGSTVSILTATDDDTDDVPELTITVDYNDYFNVTMVSSSTSHVTAAVVVKAGLVAGEFNITFRATDHCGLYGSRDVHVNVTTSPLDINTLPASTSVSETVTVETLLHNITVTPAGTYTCTFDSYSPTRAEGNPFDIKTSTFTGVDYGVYLKAGASIYYNITTLYTLVVNCSSATDTISETLTVNLDPNNDPVFQNFQSTATTSASSTPAFTVIYQATVTDPDNDTVTLTLFTDPATSAFTIDNDGNISTTEDLTYHQQTPYTLIIGASDGYSTVNSSAITLTIIDINLKPVLTNVPSGTQYVLENQAPSELFQVSYTDGNGDTATFNVNLSPAACNTMFALDSNNGSFTSLSQFDYETLTVTSCNATITAFDGKNESDASVVTIEVTNVDETPVIQQAAYLATTQELTSGTALPDFGIVVTEPEGQTVTLSLSCSSDPGYLSINSATGIVTMVTAYDIDTSGYDSYTISCDLMAADTASNTATSTLNVTVTDANDIDPAFSPASYSTSLQQGHTGYGTILTVTATDGDRTSPNNDITYSLSSVAQFNIDTSGNVHNTADLSGVAAGMTYNLVVSATDGGTPPKSGTASLTINIYSTTTTSSVTAAAGGSGSSGSGSGSSNNGDFFSSTGNIVLMALVAFLLAAVSVLAGLMVWKFCIQKTPFKNSPPRFGRQNYMVNQTKPVQPITEVPKDSFRPPSGESGISINSNGSSRTPSTDWIRRIDNLRESPITPRHINVRSLSNKTSVY